MLRPHKYIDLNNSVLECSAYILMQLSQEGVIKYDALLTTVTNKFADKTKYIFLPTLSFLYLLGKIEYHESSDTLELIE